MILPPHGLQQIVARFGDPLDFVDRKAAWEGLILAVLPLPVALPYAYGPAVIGRIRAHREVVRLLVDALTEAADACAGDLTRIAYGGCYAYRAKRSRAQLSTHAWGIAVDLDPARNPMGKAWDGGDQMIPAGVVAAFEARGFEWGGRWSDPDPQHFQACSGY